MLVNAFSPVNLADTRIPSVFFEQSPRSNPHNLRAFEFTFSNNRDNQGRIGTVLYDAGTYMVLWGAPPDSQVDPSNRFAEVDALIKDKKYDKALEKMYFVTLGLLRGNNRRVSGELFKETLLKFSRIFQLKGDFKNAVDFAHSACELDPNDSSAHQIAAIAFRRSGLVYEALQYSEEAVSQDPGNSNARQNLAISYMELDLPELALEHAVLALEKEPHRASPYITLSNALLAMDRKGEASEIVETGLGKLTGKLDEYLKLANFKKKFLN